MDVEFNDGNIYSYNYSNVVESCLNQSEATNVFQYIKRISTLSNLRNEETREKFLENKFEIMDFIGEDVALE